MPRLFTIATLAVLAFVVAATSVADSSTSSTAKSKTKTPQKSTSSSKSKTINLNSKLPTAADFKKGKRPKGQDLAKELKDNLKKQGVLAEHHPPEIENAIKAAKAKHKNLLLLFTTAKCPVCRKMQKETVGANDFKDKYLKDYVVLNIDCDKKPDLAEHYLLTPDVPQFKVIDGNGKIVKEKAGYDSDEQFADWLSAG